jgi:hypothetical protein
LCRGHAIQGPRHNACGVPIGTEQLAAIDALDTAVRGGPEPDDITSEHSAGTSPRRETTGVTDSGVSLGSSLFPAACNQSHCGCRDDHRVLRNFCGYLA